MGSEVESENGSVFIPLNAVILGSSVAAASSPPALELTTNPLFLLLLGNIIGAVISLLAVYVTYKQQLRRDELTYQRQVEREQAAYIRSLKDAKRERLRESYKTLLNTADKYHYEIQQITHMPDAVNITLTGVDEAVTEISSN